MTVGRAIQYGLFLLFCVIMFLFGLLMGQIECLKNDISGFRAQVTRLAQPGRCLRTLAIHLMAWRPGAPIWSLGGHLAGLAPRGRLWVPCQGLWVSLDGTERRRSAWRPGTGKQLGESAPSCLVERKVLKNKTKEAKKLYRTIRSVKAWDTTPQAFGNSKTLRDALLNSF